MLLYWLNILHVHVFCIARHRLLKHAGYSQCIGRVSVVHSSMPALVGASREAIHLV